MRSYCSLILFMCFVSCTDTNTGTRIAILEDITETDFIAQAEYTSITNLFSNKDDLFWDYAHFRYRTISDVRYTVVVEDSLSSASSLLGNTFKRKQEIARFFNTIETSLNTSQATASKSHSAIWDALVQEIKVCQQQTVRTDIYLFSDLQENSHWFSVYRTADLKLLDRDMDSVKELFLKQATGIAENPNVTVTVIYIPKNTRDDMAYQKIVHLYIELFDSLNIPITFKANL